MIEDDMDYLRNTEEEERRTNHFSVHGSLHGHGSHGSLHHHGSQHGHKKKGSLASISNAGAAAGQAAKSVLTGRFGDAFKRFEQGSPKHEKEEPNLISPVNGSDNRAKASALLDEDAIDETEDLPPDMRRELERRRLSEEERRVEAAAAEYRARIGAEGTAGAPPPSKASTIQKRVQSLLDEAGQESDNKRTAAGYGRFTDSPQPTGQQDASPVKAAPPPLAKKPEVGVNYPKTRQQPFDPPLPRVPTQPASAPPTQIAPPVSMTAQTQSRTVSRPSVPPKSQALRTGGGSKPQWPQPEPPQTTPVLPSKRSNAAGGGLAALLAKDLEGVPDYPPPGSSGNVDASPQIPRATTAAVESFEQPILDDDLEKDFSRRYPSLSGIEMVETEIGSGQVRGTIGKEV
jgi:AP2-associated kinase